ncbi:retrovirus-related pol polyprotein from transposon TNT 1-94 [Tanacetum coccineum]
MQGTKLWFKTGKLWFKMSGEIQPLIQEEPFQRNNTRGNGVAGNVGAQNRGGMINPGQAKPIKCYNCNGLGHIAREQVTNVDDDVDDSPENDLALNVDHIFEADECDAFDSDVDEVPLHRPHFVGVQTTLFKEVKEMEEIFDQMNNEVDKNTVDKQCAELKKEKTDNPLETENLIVNKKQVTLSDKPGTSSSNTQKHKVHQRVQLTNIPVLPSTGVNDSTEASGSKPRSNTKKNRILPAKKENKKEVEVRLRTNKSVWTKVNRVDSSISSKRVLINSNSESVNSASHGMYVVNILNSVNVMPIIRIVLNKEKQIRKPNGKLSDNSLSKTQRVWKAMGKLFADIGYQWRPTGKKLNLGKLDYCSQWRPTGKKFALGEI